MKQFILFFVLLSGISVHASTNGYKLKLNLLVDSTDAAAVEMEVKSGKTASYNQVNGGITNFIDVIASEGTVNGNKGILMKFVVGTHGPDGKKTILGSPQILTQENEETKVMVSGNEQKPGFELSVLAYRKKSVN